MTFTESSSNEETEHPPGIKLSLDKALQKNEDCKTSIQTYAPPFEQKNIFNCLSYIYTTLQFCSITNLEEYGDFITTHTN